MGKAVPFGIEVETRAASLETLAVSIQALHVNSKQMTLAVFRQLPVASPYTDRGNLLKLEFWGLVRYPIKDEGDLWAVASFDGKLYRCHVDRREKFSTVAAAQSLAQSAAKEDRQAKDCLAQAKKLGDSPYASDRVKQAAAWCERAGKELSEMPEFVECCRRAEASETILRALPQLFIAV